MLPVCVSANSLNMERYERQENRRRKRGELFNQAEMAGDGPHEEERRKRNKEKD